MARLLFEKKGSAVWISHLDLMRLFQRAFKRAGLHLKHTQGFNPRPSVSIALPLSVGVESGCELLDFELEGECPGCEEILERLNRALVAGVRVLNVYEEGRKIRDLALLRCRVWLEYDGGITEEQVEAIRQLFRRESLTVEKKGKNGPVEQDILPMIRSMEISVADGNTAVMEAVVCCQNPSLNPMLLAAAVESYLPGQAPDHCRCERIEIYDGTEAVFR